jgi:hypothetical protein
MREKVINLLVIRFEGRSGEPYLELPFLQLSSIAFQFESSHRNQLTGPSSPSSPVQPNK